MASTYCTTATLHTFQFGFMGGLNGLPGTNRRKFASGQSCARCYKTRAEDTRETVSDKPSLGHADMTRISVITGVVYNDLDG